MNRLIRSTWAAAAMVLIAAPAMAQTTPSIVFINSDQVMAQAPSLQTARQQMQSEIQALEVQARQELEPLQAEIQQMMTQFQQQQQMLAADKRREQQQAIATKQQELQQKAAAWDQRAQERQQEMLAPVLERINEAIEDLREERGYAFILDVAAGGVVAADPSLDVTGEVVERLKRSGSQPDG